MLPGRAQSVVLAVALIALAVFAVGYSLSRVPTASRDLPGTRGEPSEPVPVAADTMPKPTSVRVPILVYHNVRPAPERPLSATERQYDVTPEELAAQLAFLAAEGYASIGFGGLLAAQRGEQALPDKPVILTFDDGRATQYDHALPLLKQHGFTATFFVFSNALDRPGYFTWEQLRALHDGGMTIGGHTRYHPYLTRLKSDEELRVELEDSKRALEDGLGAPVEYLAYPFGLYDDRVIAATRTAGYLAARGLEHRTLHAAEDAYRIGAFIATGDLRHFKTILTSP